MARSTFKVLFYLKRHAEQNGKAPIMGRITINGTNSQFSCKMSIPPKHGDTEANKAADKSVVAQHINEKMENVKINIGKQYQRICDRYRIEYRDRRFLSESELRAVTNVYVPNYKTAIVKNIFVFCCFTNMAFMGFEGIHAGYMIVFIIASVAYLFSWIMIKILVPKYKIIEV